MLCLHQPWMCSSIASWKSIKCLDESDSNAEVKFTLWLILRYIMCLSFKLSFDILTLHTYTHRYHHEKSPFYKPPFYRRNKFVIFSRHIVVSCQDIPDRWKKLNVENPPCAIGKGRRSARYDWWTRGVLHLFVQSCYDLTIAMLQTTSRGSLFLVWDGIVWTHTLLYLRTQLNRHILGWWLGRRSSLPKP